MSKFLGLWDLILLLMLVVRVALEHITGLELVTIVTGTFMITFFAFKLAEKMD